MEKEMQPLWKETPLLYSAPISARLGVNAYLKLETVHPSYSFKYRGISLFIQRLIQASPGKLLHVVIASGGNAGLAAASAAKACNVKCTVYLPEIANSTTTISLLESEGANVVVQGVSYVHALAAAEKAVANIPDAMMVPAYDDHTIWEGHSSMIEEIQGALPGKPDVILCSVGGAGLLAGILMGCKRVGWSDVPIVALETNGSNCFYQSMAANSSSQFQGNTEGVILDLNTSTVPEYDVTIVHLKEIASLATSLGATSPAAGPMRLALDHPGKVKCVSISDELSMEAACNFADEHKILVELACSTTLAPAYSPELFAKLNIGRETGKPNVVFIVCGGFKISLGELQGYKTIMKDEKKAVRKVFCDGKRWY